MPADDAYSSMGIVRAATPDELYPPVQYGGWWLLLAIGIIAVIAVVVWLIVFLTRPRKPPVPSRRQAPVGEQLQRLRTDYLQRIDGVEREYSDGSMNARRANYELSRITREFVNEYTGVATPVMSLDELEAHGVHPALIDAVRRHYYPSVFRGGAVVDPAAGAKAAREVVTAWH